MPGHIRIWLKYDGKEQKPILTKEAKKRGVEIDNHSPISEFLTDDSGKIIGAVAIDVSKEQPSVKLYQAKAIVTATGIGMRLYPSVTPGWMFNQCNCPAAPALVAQPGIRSAQPSATLKPVGHTLVQSISSAAAKQPGSVC